MKAVADVLGVSRSQLYAGLAASARPRRRYHKADDATVIPRIMALVTARPTYGYRRITALLNRQLRDAEAAPVNHKRVYRIMQAHSLLLARHYAVRPDHAHDGKVVTLRSNLRWCSDGFEFAWLGTATSSAAPFSSTRTIARSSPGPSGGQRRDQQLGHPGHDARSRRGALRNPSRSTAGRDA
jgi:hypothetical protein